MAVRSFEIIEQIAHGGMAEVFRARTLGVEGFQKEVCIKRMLANHAGDERFVQMFVNEAKLAATLNCPNIVAVHDFCCSSDGEYFIVMEYVPGHDLSEVIRAVQVAGQEIPPDIAVYIARQVLNGLQYAHNLTDSEGASLNVTHRDVSPQNVLCSEQGVVKLADFGIAKASWMLNATKTGTVKGKYGYMSPEQARGEPVDSRGDIYGVGIVLYEMLVGERCFASASEFSLLMQMREAQVVPPTQINKSIPKSLEEIVLKAMRCDPAERFQDAEAMEEALGLDSAQRGAAADEIVLRTFLKNLFSPSKARDAKKRTGTMRVALSSIVASEPSLQKVESNPPPKKVKPDPPPQKVEDKPEPVERQPVGIRHLRPDLPHTLQRRLLARLKFRGAVMRVAVVLLVASFGGFALAELQDHRLPCEAILREAELPDGPAQPSRKLMPLELALVARSVETAAVMVVDPPVLRGPVGTVEIMSSPIAIIAIDGEPRGYTNGRQPLAVLANLPHHVTVTDRNRRRQLTVQIAPGEHKRIYVDLDSER